MNVLFSCISSTFRSGKFLSTILRLNEHQPASNNLALEDPRACLRNTPEQETGSNFHYSDMFDGEEPVDELPHITEMGIRFDEERAEKGKGKGGRVSSKMKM